MFGGRCHAVQNESRVEGGLHCILVTVNINAPCKQILVLIVVYRHISQWRLQPWSKVLLYIQLRISLLLYLSALVKPSARKLSIRRNCGWFPRFTSHESACVIRWIIKLSLIIHITLLKLLPYFSSDLHHSLQDIHSAGHLAKAKSIVSILDARVLVSLKGGPVEQLAHTWTLNICIFSL